MAELPSGSTVLVRGDLDAKPGAQIGEGDIRLRSMVETLEFGRQHGWKQVVFGHIGRKADETLAKVARASEKYSGCEVPLMSDWLDADSNIIRDAASRPFARLRRAVCSCSKTLAVTRIELPCFGKPGPKT